MTEIPSLHEWKEIKQSFRLPSEDNILIGPAYAHVTFTDAATKRTEQSPDEWTDYLCWVRGF